jgi:hypothetical protein
LQATLKQEEPEHFLVSLCSPLLPKLGVADIFYRMVSPDSDQEVQAEAQAPESDHEGQGQPRNQCLPELDPSGGRRGLVPCRGQQVEEHQWGETCGPHDVHNPEVPKTTGDLEGQHHLRRYKHQSEKDQSQWDG